MDQQQSGQRPQSARVRTPHSGRSNTMDQETRQTTSLRRPQSAAVLMSHSTSNNNVNSSPRNHNVGNTSNLMRPQSAANLPSASSHIQAESSSSAKKDMSSSSNLVNKDTGIAFGKRSGMNSNSSLFRSTSASGPFAPSRFPTVPPVDFDDLPVNKHVTMHRSATVASRQASGFMPNNSQTAPELLVLDNNNSTAAVGQPSNTQKVRTGSGSSSTKYIRPLVCPQRWLESQQERDWVQNKDVVIQPNDLPIQEKVEMTNKLIIRNRHRLWKLHPEYIGKQSPAEVAQSLHNMETHKFVPIMRTLHHRERLMNLGSSEQIARAAFADESHRVPVRQPDTFDPFIMSVNTSRQSRNDKMERMLLPATMNADGTFRRGYKHTYEYGNLSNFNGILNRNKEAMLDR
jgi:hypothetical protein